MRFCRADGIPQPTYSWTTPLGNAEDDNRIEISLTGVTSVLRLVDITTDYEGVFTCTATNSVGSASATANVLVAGELLILCGININY